MISFPISKAVATSLDIRMKNEQGHKLKRLFILKKCNIYQMNKVTIKESSGLNLATAWPVYEARSASVLLQAKQPEEGMGHLSTRQQ